MKLTPGRVSLESIPNPGSKDGAWPAFLAPGDWNGWAIPYFEQETVGALVAALDAAPGTRAWTHEYAVIVVTEEATFPEERFLAEEVEGARLFPVGAWSWCWQRVE